MRRDDLSAVTSPLPSLPGIAQWRVFRTITDQLAISIGLHALGNRGFVTRSKELYGEVEDWITNNHPSLKM